VDAAARGRPSRRARLGLALLKPILVVNAGSTSLKLRLVANDESVTAVESLDDVPAAEIAAVAHRVVHGGSLFREAVVIDGEVRDAIAGLRAIAPLHNTPALEAIETAARALPGVPHLAVFDTAFHATIPPAAATYAVPRRWREDWDVRRYGFHGLSVAWSTERAAAMLGRAPGDVCLVVCHLGGGSSVTGVRDGRSADTTMGFSPLEGVPMNTRSGSVDPGALLHLLRSRGLDAGQLDHALNFESGLTALAGATGQKLEQAAADGDPDAALALDVFTYRVAGAVAAMAVAAGRLDALVFTAGIGEGSAEVRSRVCGRLGLLGVRLDPERNAAAAPDCDVSAGAVPVLVIRAREELVIARAARALVG
jgi:acetate kinase